MMSCWPAGWRRGWALAARSPVARSSWPAGPARLPGQGGELGARRGGGRVGAGRASVLLAGLPAAPGWRAVCWLAVLPVGLSLLLHRFVRESELSRQMRRRGGTGGLRYGAAALFQPGLCRTTLLVSLLAFRVQGSGLVLLVWLPTYLASVRHGVGRRGGLGRAGGLTGRHHWHCLPLLPFSGRRRRAAAAGNPRPGSVVMRACSRRDGRVGV